MVKGCKRFEYSIEIGEIENQRNLRTLWTDFRSFLAFRFYKSFDFFSMAI